MAELHLDVISTASSKGLTDAARDLKATRGEADKLGKSFDELGENAFDLDAAIEKSRGEVRRLSDEFKRTGDQSLFSDLRKERSWLRNLKQVAEDVEATRSEADKLSKSFDGLEHEAFDLEAAIEKSRLELTRLSDEFKKTGDRSLLVDIRREKSWLSDLSSVAADGIRAGTAAGEAFSTGFSGRMSLMNPKVIAALVGVAAVLAPAIGAIVAGAVAGTVTGGGIAGGIFAASKDTRVQSAWSDFADDLTAEAFGGGAFVQPLVEGLKILKGAFAELGIDETLTKAASSVPILAQGIADLAENIMPGLNKVFDQSETFTRVFADGLGDVGFALSDFLGSLMDSEGTIEGLAYGFKLLSGAIIFTGDVLEFLGDTFHAMAAFSAELTGVVEDFIGWLPIGWIPGVEDAVRGMNDALEETLAVDWGGVAPAAALARALAEGEIVVTSFGEAADEAATEVLLFESAIDDVYHSFLDLTGAEINAEAALDDLQESLEKHGTTMDIDTAAGRENVGNLKDYARAAEEARRKTYEQTESVEAANAKYGEYRQRLYDTFLQLTGNAEMAQTLTDKWLALADLPDLSKNVYVTTHYSAIDAYLAGNVPRGFVQGYAHGGPVAAHGTYLVGEEGPELLQMGSQGGRVWPNVPAAGGWGGGGSQSFELVIRSGGSQMDDLLVQILSRAVKARGGNVQVALGA